MLRRKYRAGNLKQDKERKIARYLESFLSQIRDPEGKTPGRKDTGKGEEEKENATVSDSSSKEATDRRIVVSKKLRGTDNSVAIGLTTFNNPGPSKVQPNNTSFARAVQGKSKSTRDNTTQMRQNLSTQRLQGNEDIEDDSSLVENVEMGSKYILVGWDNFRSMLMVILLVLLILWAAIYFPLIGT